MIRGGGDVINGDIYSFGGHKKKLFLNSMMESI